MNMMEKPNSEIVKDKCLFCEKDTKESMLVWKDNEAEIPICRVCKYKYAYLCKFRG